MVMVLIITIMNPTTLTKSAKRILMVMVLIITIIMLTTLTKTAVMVTIRTTGN